MSLSRRFTKECFVVTFCVLGAASSRAYAAPLPGLSQLGGWAYIDRNNDGMLAFSNQPNPEFAIDNMSISLFATVGNVQTLASTMLTDQFGRYLFENIAPGTYMLVKTPSVDFVNGRDTLGVLESFDGQPIPGNASAGVAMDNAFSNIVLTPNVGGDFYLFGELGLQATAASKRFLFATAPIPPPPPPPPEPEGEGEPDVPEPTSLVIAMMAVGGPWLAARRVRPRLTNST